MFCPFVFRHLSKVCVDPGRIFSVEKVCVDLGRIFWLKNPAFSLIFLVFIRPATSLEV